MGGKRLRKEVREVSSSQQGARSSVRRHQSQGHGGAWSNAGPVGGGRSLKDRVVNNVDGVAPFFLDFCGYEGKVATGLRKSGHLALTWEARLGSSYDLSDDRIFDMLRSVSMSGVFWGAHFRIGPRSTSSWGRNVWRLWKVLCRHEPSLSLTVPKHAFVGWIKRIARLPGIEQKSVDMCAFGAPCRYRTIVLIYNVDDVIKPITCSSCRNVCQYSGKNHLPRREFPTYPHGFRQSIINAHRGARACLDHPVSSRYSIKD